MCRPAAAAALVLLTACLSGVLTSRRINDRPIIGVMAQETDPGDFYRQGSSYIPASYVKYLEAAGARVVPIRIKRPEEEYIKLFNSINGFFLPGGDVDIVKSESSRAARIFLNLALKAAAREALKSHMWLWSRWLPTPGLEPVFPVGAPISVIKIMEHHL